MTVQQIRVMARQLGIQKYWRLRKPDLIRSVQRAEGHDPCFASDPQCEHLQCLWRADCMNHQQAENE